jgi:hypothetical protein
MPGWHESSPNFITITLHNNGRVDNLITGAWNYAPFRRGENLNTSRLVGIGRFGQVMLNYHYSPAMPNAGFPTIYFYYLELPINKNLALTIEIQNSTVDYTIVLSEVIDLLQGLIIKVKKLDHTVGHYANYFGDRAFWRED